MNRGGGKFFRPQGPDNDNTFDSDGSSDDSDDYEGDDVAVTAPVQPPVNKSKQTANLSSSEEDDSDDNESDDDDNDNAPSKTSTGTSNNNNNKRKNNNNNSNSKQGHKSKKAKPSFIDEEAEASDDDSIEEEDYGTHHDPHDRVKKHYTQEDIRRENMDDEALAIINRQNRRRNHLAQFGTEDDAEDIARQIEERHRMAHHRVDRRVLEDADASIHEHGNQNLSAVSQQSLLPSVSDPSLWMFGCQTGKEQELVYQIMNKCIAFARQGKPLGITSAVAAQSKGRIYIESFSEPAVREAMQGIRGLMVYSMRLVPISDMTTVMTVTPKKKPGK